MILENVWLPGRDRAKSINSDGLDNSSAPFTGTQNCAAPAAMSNLLGRANHTQIITELSRMKALFELRTICMGMGV